jgi:PII-like signaling protein
MSETTERNRSIRIPERWFEVVSTILGLVVVGLLGWFGNMQIGMRDDIHTLKDQLPAIVERVDRLESRVDKLDDVVRERR